jgi:hypothetical protein
VCGRIAPDFQEVMDRPPSFAIEPNDYMLTWVFRVSTLRTGSQTSMTWLRSHQEMAALRELLKRQPLLPGQGMAAPHHADEGVIVAEGALEAFGHSSLNRGSEDNPRTIGGRTSICPCAPMRPGDDRPL